MKYLRGILLPALLALASIAAGKKDAPFVKVTAFDEELINLLYFEDSEVVLATEFGTGKLWRSDDAGKKWDETDIETVIVIKSPFDKQLAVALGEANHHQITEDRGKTWREFKTERSPSLAGMPISFHATDSKKMLFHGQENYMTGIGSVSNCVGDDGGIQY